MNKCMVLAALVMSAFLSPAQSADAEDMKGMTMKPATSPADRAFAASMKTMMNAMNVKPTGKPRQGFRSHDDSAPSRRGRHGQG